MDPELLDGYFEGYDFYPLVLFSTIDHAGRRAEMAVRQTDPNVCFWFVNFDDGVGPVVGHSGTCDNPVDAEKRAWETAETFFTTW